MLSEKQNNTFMGGLRLGLNSNKKQEKIKIEYPDENSKEYERIDIICSKIAEIVTDISDILNNADEDCNLNCGEWKIYQSNLIFAFNKFQEILKKELIEEILTDDNEDEE